VRVGGGGLTIECPAFRAEVHLASKHDALGHIVEGLSINGKQHLL